MSSTRTRSGRLSKPPAPAYVPDELPEDDYATSEYDSDSGGSDYTETRSDDGSDDGASLASFIASDDEEEEEPPESETEDEDA